MDKTMGYVRLWRCMMDDRIFANKALFHTWLWCLMKANHNDSTWVPVKCGGGESEVQVMRGQFVFGRIKAGKELDLKPMTALNHLKKLERLGFLITKSFTQWTLVTICNYEDYSGRLEEVGHENGQAVVKLVATDLQPFCTSKELKNLKNERIREKKKESVSGEPKRTASQLFDEWWIATKLSPAYKGIDMDREIERMKVWLTTPKGKGRKLSKRFIVNWLNKIDAPVEVAKPKPKLAY